MIVKWTQACRIVQYSKVIIFVSFESDCLILWNKVFSRRIVSEITDILFCIEKGFRRITDSKVEGKTLSENNILKYSGDFAGRRSVEKVG